MHKTTGLPVIRKYPSAVSAAACSWWRDTISIPRFSASMNMAKKIRIRDSEQRVDSLGLDEIEDTFVD